MKMAYKFGIILFAVLTALVLGSNSYLLLWNFTGSIRDIIRLLAVIIVLLTVIYTIIGYKKPHGNLLKILMLLFAVTIIPEALRDASDGWTLHALLNMVSMICIAYVAGRLDRIKQNNYLMLFVLLLLIVARIVLELVYKSSVDVFVFMGRSSHIIVWLDLCVSYFLRYREHKEAGLIYTSEK